MATYYKSRKSYVVSFRLKGLPRERIHGIKTLAIARQVAQAKTLEEQLVKTGLHRPQPNAAKFEAAENKSIETHIADFEQSILHRARHPQHAQQTAAHVRRLCKLASIARLSQIDAGAIQEAAKKLMDESGLAPRTANAAIKAARQFSTWLDGAKRTAGDLLHRRLHTYNEAVDQRRLRRALSIEEFERLVAAVFIKRPGKQPAIRGEDRAMLYQVAVGTGFRQRSCLSLSKASFFVDPKLVSPYVRLGAAFNKNGKDRDQKIRKDLAALLFEWLKSKPDTGLLWNAPKHAHLELLVKRDLEAARAAWLKEAEGDAKETERREKSSFLLYQDHAGRYADFHGLRHTGISLLVRGAGLRAAQVWADHSSPLLTAKYAHLDLADEEKGMNALPPAQARQRPHLTEKSGKVRNKTENRKIG